MAKTSTREQDQYRNLKKKIKRKNGQPSSKERERKRQQRLDPVYRSKEQVSNTISHKDKRYGLSTEDSQLEQTINTQSRRMARMIDSWEDLLVSYERSVLETPKNICACCGGLWFISSVRKADPEMIKMLVGADLCESLMVDGVHFLCSTCYQDIKKGLKPRLCLSNGLHFPVIPEELKGLTILEERLVSPRLPFMQIRSLGQDRQYGLNGGVVNVPNNLDIVAKVLPRSFDNTSTIQVMLQRKMSYQKPYMYQTIRPYKVFVAAKYLITTELYRKENITLSEDWAGCNESSLENYVIDPKDDISTVTEETELLMEANNVASEEVILNEERELDIPLTETLLIVENHAVKIAPGENQRPLSLLMDLNAELLSFPTIYGGQERQLLDKRISLADVARSEIRRFDRRCGKPHKIFYSYKKLQTHRLIENINLCLRKKRRKGKVTAGDLLSSENVENIVQQDDGYRILRNVVNSPAYLEEKKKNLMSMIRQRGIPTFFITLSAAETKWGELLSFLHNLKTGEIISPEAALTLSFESKADLIREEPVICVMYYAHRLQALHHLMRPSTGVFEPFKTVDYFERLEVQQRGSLHCHELNWMEKSPKYDPTSPSSSASCVEFIDQYITCSRDTSEEMSDLLTYQLHRHSHSCKKGRTGRCRYNFPIPPMRQTLILTPLNPDISQAKQSTLKADFDRQYQFLVNLGRNYTGAMTFEEFLSELDLTEERYILCIRSTLKRPKPFLRRCPNEAYINQYNRKLLLAFKANCDVQFVLDAYATASYCVNYISKADRGVSKLLRDVDKAIRGGDVLLKDRLRMLANTFARGSEVSAQEAACCLLRIPMTSCSRDTVFVNTGPPDERVILVKNLAELEEMDAESEEVAETGLLDRYVIRSKNMESVCLADFAARFRFVNTKKRKNTKLNEPKAEYLLDNSGCIVPRTQSKILRYRRYGRHQDPSNFFREQLMLYLPWRNESADLVNQNCEVLYSINLQLISQNRKEYDPFQTDEDITNAFDKATAAMEDDFTIEDTLPSQRYEFIDNDDLKQDVGLDLGKSFSTFENIRPLKQLENVDFLSLMRSLNEGQRRFLYHTLHRTKLGLPAKLELVHGQAGVGKSRLIEAITQCIMRFCQKEVGRDLGQFPVLIAGPTGKASFNVSGMTLHCAFRLPPSQYDGEIAPLNFGASNTLRTSYLGIKLIILEEVSMISLKHLKQIDCRLRQIFGCQENFAGIPILALGDFWQLRPVFGQFVFEVPRGKYAGIIGNMLWEDCEMFELTEIMRQRDDAIFAGILNRLSIGQLTEVDLILLKSREIKNANNNVQPDVIRLFRSNNECEKYNTEFLHHLKTTSYHCWALDTIQGNGPLEQRTKMLEFAKTFSTQEADGIPSYVCLKVGSQYMITTNIDVSQGLFNGATGVLKDVKVGILTTGESVVQCAFIHFANSSIGTTQRLQLKYNSGQNILNTEWTPIYRETRALQKTGYQQGMQIVRTQIPLAAANGITIHKAQGSSYKEVVVCIPEKGLTRTELYVACSRCTSLQGLSIDGFFKSPKPVEPSHPVSMELKRLRDKKFKWSMPYLPEIDDKWNKLVFHNVQSYMAHSLDIVVDQVYNCSDCLCFVETWTLSQDVVELNGFQTIQRIDSESSRSSYGSLVYMRTPVAPNPRFRAVKDFKGYHVQITTFMMDSIAVHMIYRHPNCQPQLLYLELQQELSRILGRPAIYFGDFNIDILAPAGIKLLKIFNDFGFKLCQRLEATTDANSMLDAVFSNITLLQGWSYESYFSFHKPICMIWPKVGSDVSEMPSTVSDILFNLTMNPRNSISPRVLESKTAVINSEQTKPSSEDRDESGAMNVAKIDITKYGLSNLGNTCYLNSVIQMLGECITLVEDINSNDNVLQDSVMKYIRATRAPTSLQNLQKIKSTLDIGLPQFANADQHDSHEFLMSVLAGFGPESEIRQRFIISGVAHLNCRCGYQSHNPFQDVGLTIFGSDSLQSSLSNYFQTTIVTDFRCGQCNEIDTCRQNMELVNAPDFLIIQMSRFSSSGTKLGFPLNYSAQINIPTKNSANTYRQKAVISHIGPDMNQGHYVTSVPNDDLSWTVFDDEVTYTSKLPPDDGYILLFEHI